MFTPHKSGGVQGLPWRKARNMSQRSFTLLAKDIRFLRFTNFLKDFFSLFGFPFREIKLLSCVRV